MGIYANDFDTIKLKNQFLYLPTIIKPKIVQNANDSNSNKSLNNELSLPLRKINKSTKKPLYEKSVFGDKEAISLHSIIKILEKEPDSTINLLDEVIKLINLVMTPPATSVYAERAFSALRRILTYLRTHDSEKIM